MMAKESKLPAPYNKSEEANKQTANGVGRTRQRAIKIAEAKTIQTYAGAEPPKASSRMALIFYCYYPVYPMFMHTHSGTARIVYRRESTCSLMQWCAN